MKILIFSLLAIFVKFQVSGEVDSAFRSAKIIPEIVDNRPLDELKIKYGQVKVNLGNDLTRIDLSYKPEVTYNFQREKFYTLIMADPDTPLPIFPFLRENFHWVVGNIPENRIGEGQEIVEYLRPTAPPGSASHRYTFLLYRQPGKLVFETPRARYPLDLPFRFCQSARAFARRYNLGQPIAGNFYRAGFNGPIFHGAYNLF